MAFTIVGFAVCFVVIIFSGARLSRYGDVIAARSGMGKAWFGLIMMAAVTSLPELFTGISSIAIIDAPDIAVGNIVGSCAFNLFILVILDAFVRKKSFFGTVSQSQVVACLCGIFLLTVLVMALLFNSQVPTIGWVSVSSILLTILYLVAVYLIFNTEKAVAAQAAEAPSSRHAAGIGLRTATKWYSLYACIVIAGSVSLPYFANRLANETGISQSFIGTLLVAVATSLPELVVSIEAVKIGSPDIAMGNLLGSNIFNILIVSIEDLLYRQGALLSVVSDEHLFSGLITILMSVVVGIAIFDRSGTKKWRLSIASLVLVFLYCLLMILLF